jgi:hypothetical protein
MLGAQGLWAGRNLYRATPTVTRDLGLNGLIQKTSTHVPQWDSNLRRKGHQIFAPDALTTVPWFLFIFAETDSSICLILGLSHISVSPSVILLQDPVNISFYLALFNFDWNSPFINLDKNQFSERFLANLISMFEWNLTPCLPERNFVLLTINSKCLLLALYQHIELLPWYV